VHAQAGEGADGERESQAHSALSREPDTLSREPDTGLNFTTLRS